MTAYPVAPDADDHIQLRPDGALRRDAQVLVIAVVVGSLTAPGQTFGVSVFIDPIVEDLGVSRRAVGVAYLIGTLFGALLLPTVGRLVDRWGVRPSQIAVGSLFALALCNMSWVSGLAGLVVGFAGIRFLGQGALTMLASISVQLHYQHHRGRALGVHTTLVSGFIALAPLLLSLSIGQFGWRATWVISGIVVAMVVVPCTIFGLRTPSLERPGKGSKPVAGTTATRSSPGLTRAQALRTRAFWVLAAVVGTSALVVTAFNFHQVDLFGEVGISRRAAAALFLPQVVGSMVTGLAIGYLSDRLGIRFLPATTMVLLVAAQICGAMAAPGLVAIGFATLLGAAAGAMRTVFVVLIPAWFGLEHVGAISGTLTLVLVGASSAGPITLTLLSGAFGSYRAALFVLCSLPLAAFGFAFRSARESSVCAG